MTPPANYPSPTGRKGKRVEFSPTLGSIDSQAPLSPASPDGTWDAETDYMLSFLIGPEGHSSGSRLPDFPSSAGDSSRPSGHVAEFSPSVGPSPQARANANAANNMDGTAMEEDDEPPLPLTPAVHYFESSHTSAHGTSSVGASAAPVYPSYSLSSSSVPTPPSMKPPFMQSAPPPGPENPDAALTSNSSSSSSLTSMAAALVSGGPLVFQQLQQQQQPQQQLAASTTGTASPMDARHTSPISPAELIGQGNENLMLPTASRRPSNAAERERHLAWIREINARAKAAAVQSTGGGNQAAPPLTHPGAPPVAAPMAPSMPPSIAPSPAMPFPGMAPFVMVQPNHPLMYAQAAALQAAAAAQSETPAESKKKREERLARNRESARKSRARRKERLLKGEAQVNRLHGELDMQRRKLLSTMIPELRAAREKETAKILEEQGDAADLTRIICDTGPNSQIAPLIVDSQYSTLKQLTLPRYAKMMLWFTLRDDAFFAAGKEAYMQREAARQGGVVRSTTNKPGSRAIGDELTNGPKAERGATKQQSLQPTAYAYDAARMWPLLCYELEFGVDQEDRFVAANKMVQSEQGLADTRSQMAAAVRTTDGLKEAVTSLGRVISDREQKTLVGILKPSQVAAYQNWLSSNSDRCRSILERRGALEKASLPSGKETSLLDICRKLDEVLQISMEGGQVKDMASF